MQLTKAACTTSRHDHGDNYCSENSTTPHHTRKRLCRISRHTPVRLHTRANVCWMDSLTRTPKRTYVAHTSMRLWIITRLSLVHIPAHIHLYACTHTHVCWTGHTHLYYTLIYLCLYAHVHTSAYTRIRVHVQAETKLT